MDFTTIIGIVGATLILIGFTTTQFNIWKTTSVQYDSINLIGGGLLLWYALLIASLPFIILNGIWFLVALRDVLGYFFKKH